MSIIRVHKNENYSCINNEFLNNEKLSWGAKGLLTFLLSKPDNWKIILNHLRTCSSNGIDSTRTKLNELEKAGYLEKGERIREKGQLKGYNYDLYESLDWKNQFRKSKLENPIILNTDGINTDKNNKAEPEGSVPLKENNCLSKGLINHCLNKFYNKVILIKPDLKKEIIVNETEFKKCENLINYFINGFPLESYHKLRIVIKNNNLNMDLFNNGFKDEDKFLDEFEKTLKVFESEYKPDNKSLIDTKLSLFLYNHHKNLISYFFFYACKGVERHEQPLKDNHPKITEHYIKNYFGSDWKESIKNRNEVIKFSRDIYNERVLITEQKIKYGNKKYIREDIESDVFRTQMSLTNFLHNHLEFINHITKNKSLAYLSLNNFSWEKFEKMYKDNHNIEFYPKEDLLKLKVKVFLKNQD